MISDGTTGWEPMLPSGIAEIIKEHQLLATCQKIFLKEVINKSAEYSNFIVYYNCS
jgi:hypothetical protein